MKIKIGLLWHNIYSPNRGVSALTLANMDLLKQAFGDCEFYVLGYGTVVDNKKQECVEIIPFGLSEVLRLNFDGIYALRKCDVVIDIGEGDSFYDIYGLKRIVNQFFTKDLAKYFCGKLIFAPQTYGPFDHWWGRMLGRLSAKFSDAVFSRDDKSAETFSKLTNINVERFTDLAFALPFTQEKKGQVVGINVSGLLYSEDSNDFGLGIDYKIFTHRIIEHFLSNNVKVELISHVSGGLERESDQKVCDQLLKKYPTLHCAPEYVSPSDIKSRISQYEFFIGARMHATIAAFGAGVPVVPVAYSMKFSGVFNRLGYSTILEAKAHTTDSAVEYIKNMYSRREDLRIDVVEGNKLSKKYLNEYVARVKEVVVD